MKSFPEHTRKRIFLSVNHLTYGNNTPLVLLGNRQRGIYNSGEVHWSHAIRVLACLLALINRFIYTEAMSAGPSLALSSISAYIHVHIISLLAAKGVCRREGGERKGGTCRVQGFHSTDNVRIELGWFMYRNLGRCWHRNLDDV